MIKKILKYLGFTLLFLIALIILLPIIFKGKIVEMVKEESNNNLNAQVDFGEFDLGLISTFPNFEFSIDNVKVDATYNEVDVIEKIVTNPKNFGVPKTTLFFSSNTDI